jgi:hypothetical protein
VVDIALEKQEGVPMALFYAFSRPTPRGMWRLP